MQLTAEQIKRFKDAWEKDFKIKLTDEEAQSELARLIFFFKIMRETFRKEH